MAKCFPLSIHFFNRNFMRTGLNLESVTGLTEEEYQAYHIPEGPLHDYKLRKIEAAEKKCEEEKKPKKGVAQKKQREDE